MENEQRIPELKLQDIVKSIESTIEMQKKLTQEKLMLLSTEQRLQIVETRIETMERTLMIIQLLETNRYYQLTEEMLEELLEKIADPGE